MLRHSAIQRKGLVYTPMLKPIIMHAFIQNKHK